MEYNLIKLQIVTLRNEMRLGTEGLLWQMFKCLLIDVFHFKIQNVAEDLILRDLERMARKHAPRRFGSRVFTMRVAKRYKSDSLDFTCAFWTFENIERASALGREEAPGETIAPTAAGRDR